MYFYSKLINTDFDLVYFYKCRFYNAKTNYQYSGILIL